MGMRTRTQAARVAAATSGTHLPGKPKPDGTPTLSRYVDVGGDFEAHRGAVEFVSVLFDLYDGDADGFARTSRPGVPLPTGWKVTAAKLEVDWPTHPRHAAHGPLRQMRHVMLEEQVRHQACLAFRASRSLAKSSPA